MQKQNKEIDTRNLEGPSLEGGLRKSPEDSAEALREERGAQQENLQQLKEKIEKTEVDDSLKMQVASQAQNMKLLGEEKKLKKLVSLAKTKGVIYAVNVAKKMNDPYILDMLHDILAKEGYYKNLKL